MAINRSSSYSKSQSWEMAFDDPVVWLLIITMVVAIPALALYGVYKLVRFLIKVNSFIDQQDREKRKQELSSR